MGKPSDLAFSFEAVLIAATKDKNGYVVKLAIHPSDVPDHFVKDPVGSRYQLAGVQLSDTGEPVGKKRDVGSDAVQHSALICKNPKFQQYMHDKHSAPQVSEADARNALVDYCGIESRAELKTDPRAVKLFWNLISGYEDYLG